MPIETLRDIIEELADKFGIYGAACASPEECESCTCRVMWSANMRDRINAAVSIERRLNESVACYLVEYINAEGEPRLRYIGAEEMSELNAARALAANPTHGED